jgi:NAD(P)-dependent dehydrogenase (short-subunit alcohol dehydrogenase family)
MLFRVSASSAGRLRVGTTTDTAGMPRSNHTRLPAATAAPEPLRRPAARDRRVGLHMSWEVDDEEWWKVVEVNVLGTFVCSRAVMPAMVARGAGRIVNVSSNAAFFRSTTTSPE